jgi:tRNA U54 and U55 pseudouridine synthase Pus10
MVQPPAPVQHPCVTVAVPSNMHMSPLEVSLAPLITARYRRDVRPLPQARARCCSHRLLSPRSLLACSPRRAGEPTGEGTVAD